MKCSASVRQLFSNSSENKHPFKWGFLSPLSGPGTHIYVPAAFPKSYWSQGPCPRSDPRWGQCLAQRQLQLVTVHDQGWSIPWTGSKYSRLPGSHMGFGSQPLPAGVGLSLSWGQLHQPYHQLQSRGNLPLTRSSSTAFLEAAVWCAKNKSTWLHKQ